MQVSLTTLKFLADQGDQDANFAMIAYGLHTAQHKPVEAYYTGDVFVIHVPKEIAPGTMIPRRPYTLTGMPAITPSDIIIQDNDGGADDDE